MALRLLRLPELCSQIGLRPTSIYARIKAGTLPPPIALAARSRAWPEHEIEAVIGSMIAGHGDDEIRALVHNLVAQRQSARTPIRKASEAQRRAKNAGAAA